MLGFTFTNNIVRHNAYGIIGRDRAPGNDTIGAFFPAASIVNNAIPTVLVADDQSMVRAGFRMLLAGEPDIEVVAEASNGLEAVDKAARFDPTVVLMDIRMPELDGIEATRQIIAAAGDRPVRVLMLTTFDLNEYVYEALRAGASGFLLKDVPPEHLVDGIRAVANGDALLAPSITRRLVEEFVRSAPSRAGQSPVPGCWWLAPRPRARTCAIFSGGRSRACGSKWAASR